MKLNLSEIRKLTLKISTLLLVSLLIQGCVETQNSGKKKSTSEASSSSTNVNDSSPTEPTFSSSVNYFQDGTSIYTSNFPIGANFTDSFYFRGPELHNFATAGNQLIPQCLVVEFSAASTVLVMTASPRSFINFSTSVQEFYYLFEPSNTNLNQAYCQQPGVLNYVATNYPTATAVYNISSVCNNCNINDLKSSDLEMISQSGNDLTTINTSYLSIKLKTEFFDNTPPFDGACTTSTECKSKGFDCCSLGQCVDDGQVKDNVDQGSTDFLQAQEDIIDNPSNIHNYPNFFHICAIEVTPTPTPVATINPSDDELLRFVELQELYECTTRLRGEMSWCTVTYKSASDQPSNVFDSGVDDQTFEHTWTGSGSFSSTPISHGVVKVEHAGETLFENGVIPSEKTGSVSLTSGNTSLTEGVAVTLNHTAAASAPNDDLKIKYQIDGSCVEVNSKIAKCKKFYVQGQNKGYTDDHFPGSNKFTIPIYADLQRSVRVEVDGAVKLKNTHWELKEESTNYIQFFGTELAVYDTQIVMIEFFVETDSYPVLASKMSALNRIDEICDCGGPDCRLKPVTELEGQIEVTVDYECVYPDNDFTEPPLQMTFLMSAKSAPHRFFDKTGLDHNKVKIGTLDLEGQQVEQEGSPFEYTNNNYQLPNTLDDYVGFNEIYGSMTIDLSSTQPAVEAKIENGKTYDIFVDTGVYATCFFCGNDYYSLFAKLFPSNFTFKGGGYRPDESTTSRSTLGLYRADDLIFGRACWIPATMIPWTHNPQDDRQEQRLDRLSAQHFLYANGYQRDWYGFDYGAMIASFDGVNWFAVGNQRQIKATADKIFFAINAPFADLAANHNFQVTISEASITVGAGSQVTDDDESDGAECRKYHFCEKDSDCATQLGWEYSCETVSNIRTNWPVFDQNAKEIPNDEKSLATFKSLFASDLSASVKRCVYRGKGAPCHQEFLGLGSSSSYNGITAQTDGDVTKDAGTLACAPAYYCQKIKDGVNQEKFSNTTVRWARTIATINAEPGNGYTDLDEFGRHAKLIGRPWEFKGTEAIADPGAQSNLSRNNVESLCLPGKAQMDQGSLITYEEQNMNTPNDQEDGDRTTGIGITRTGDSENDTYVISCGIFDDEGDYLYKKYASKEPSFAIDWEDSAGTSSLRRISGSQATTTNMMEIFEGNVFGELELTKDFSTEQIQEPIYEKNRCLRLPGSPCHTDMDCAANSRITDLTIGIDTDNSDFSGDLSIGGELNAYEIKFWQQKMVCGQAVDKDHDDYDLKNNRCCRESGNDVAIPHTIVIPGSENDYGGDDNFPSQNIPRVVGDSVAPVVDSVDIGDLDRSTINALWTIEESTSNNASTNDYHSRMVAPLVDQCNDTGGGTQDLSSCLGLNEVRQDYNVLQKIGKRMCCTQNWIRKFHEDNGGGHDWDSSKHQTIPVETFRCINWNACPDCGDSSLTDCSHVEDPNDPLCTYREIFNSEARRYMHWFERLELTGIPQIAIPGYDGFIPDHGYKYNKCIIDPDDITRVQGDADDSDDDDSGDTNGDFIPDTVFEVPVFPNTILDLDIGENGTLTDRSEAEFTPEDSSLYSVADMLSVDADDFDMDSKMYSSTDEGNFKTEDGIKMLFSPDEITCCKPAGTVMEPDDPHDLCCTGFVSANGRRCALKDYTNVSVYFNLYVSSALTQFPEETYKASVNHDTGFIDDEELVMNLACQAEVCDSNKVAVGTAWGPMTIKPFDASIATTNRFVESSSERRGYGSFYEAGMKWNIHVYCVPAATSISDLVDNGGIMARDCAASQ